MSWTKMCPKGGRASDRKTCTEIEDKSLQVFHVTNLVRSMDRVLRKKSGGKSFEVTHRQGPRIQEKALTIIRKLLNSPSFLQAIVSPGSFQFFSPDIPWVCGAKSSCLQGWSLPCVASLVFRVFFVTHNRKFGNQQDPSGSLVGRTSIAVSCAYTLA